MLYAAFMAFQSMSLFLNKVSNNYLEEDLTFIVRIGYENNSLGVNLSTKF